jgi:hypothetical protein
MNAIPPSESPASDIDYHVAVTYEGSLEAVLRLHEVAQDFGLRSRITAEYEPFPAIGGQPEARIHVEANPTSTRDITFSGALVAFGELDEAAVAAGVA